MRILTIVLSSVTFVATATTATNIAPWVGPTGQMGVMAGGVW